MGLGDFPEEGGFDPLGFLSSLFGGGSSGGQGGITSPNIIANPNVQQGALSNSIILGPQVGGSGGGGGGGGGFFGLGGGGAGGSGGSNSDFVDQHNTTVLASNPPPPITDPSTPNLLSGSTFANQLGISPGPQFNSPSGGQNPMGALLASMPGPIASGGYFPIVQSPLNQPSSGGGETVAPGYSSPPTFNGSAQQAGGYQLPPGMSMQQRMAGAANPMVMANGLVAPPAPYDASAAVNANPQLQQQSGQMDNSAQPMTADTGQDVTPSEPLDATLNDYNNQLEHLKSQVPAVTHGAIDAFGKTTKGLLQEHDNKTAPLRADLQKEEENLQKARDENRALSEPKEMEKLVENTREAIYNGKSPAQKALIDSIQNGTAGTMPASSHPQRDTLLKLMHHVGRAMQASMGEQGLVITEMQGDMNKRHLQQEALKQQHAAAQHEYDEFSKEVNQSVGHQLSTSNQALDATKSMVSDKRQQLNHADEQLKSGVTMAKDMIFGPANEYLKGLTDQAGMVEKQAANYSRGTNINNQKIGQAQRNRGLDIQQQRANTGGEALALSKEKNEQAQDKLKADLGKKNEELRRMKAEFPAGLPKRAKDEELDKYRIGLFKGYRNGQWSKEDATKAFFYEQAKGE